MENTIEDKLKNVQDSLNSILRKLEEMDKGIKVFQKDINTPVPQSILKKMSLKEFLLSKKVNNYVQKALLVGFYLERYEGLEFFNIKDLEAAFRNAKEPLPKNLSDTINKNIIKGHMMENKEKKDKMKSWTLTSSGEKEIDNFN